MAEPREEKPTTGRLSGDEVAGLSTHLATLTASGLPLAPGLWATGEEMPHGPVRNALLKMPAAIDAGESLDQALAAQGAQLPGHLRGIVRAGAKSGRMGEVLGRLVAFTSVGVELRRKLWLSMAYPIIALSLSLGVLLFICTSLVRAFESIFSDFGIPIPVLTRVLIELSRFFSYSATTMVEGVVGLLVLALLARVLLNAATRRALIAGIPVVGGVWRNTSLAEFCHLLALLLECDLPLPDALGLTGEGVRDAAIDRACRLMRTDVEGGVGLSDAIGRQKVFPRGLTRVLRWAEGHRGLTESLHMAGELFEARARAQAGLAGTVMTVIAVLAIMSGIACVVIGLLLPMITLISKLSG